MIPHSDRVSRRASEPSRSRVDDGGGGSGTFHGIWLGCLGFFRIDEYIGEGAASVGTRGPLTMWWCGRRGCAAVWCGRLGALPHLSFRLRVRDRKICTSAFVSSNSENISRITSLKYKSSRKQELTLWHLINRLVPKMHKNAIKCK